MKQSAEDIGCSPEAFTSDANILVPFSLGRNAKKYYKLPIEANLISYGNNVVAATTEKLSEAIGEYINRFEFYHCFETPNMYWLNELIEPKGFTVCFMAEYYLSDLNRLSYLPCDYKLSVLEPDEFEELYMPEWSNALCSDRKQLDVLCVGAYDGDKLIAKREISKAMTGIIPLKDYSNQ